ncbi:MAG: dihydroorotate dehydrogenase electron transfer subunit [Spirochaetaceae bacterium]|nr:dihydroorotate dehydrogenase electron transfer subunit [Spirochaetaceae bacterium]
MRQFQARIIANRPVAEAWRELVLEWEAEPPEPGQFLTLRVSPRLDPLLRRPFAFSGFSPADPAGGAPATASAVYQVRGSATALLAEIAPGNFLDAIGPLGKPFPLPAAGETALLAGGGIGLGPVLFLARRLRALAAAGQGSPEPRLLLGFRNAASLPELDLPEGSLLCTDDGSAGFRGTPTAKLAADAALAELGHRARLYACGPAAMLAGLAALAKERGWRASLSAEQWMACGVGACMGCALPRADGQGYLRACADGPVFEGGEIDWAAEAARAAPPVKAGAAPRPAQGPAGAGPGKERT